MRRIKAFMKKVLYWTVIPLLVIVGIYFLFFHSSEVSYTTPNVIKEEVIKEVNQLDPLYEQREAELAEKYRKIQSLEARIDVNKTEIDRLMAENKALTTDLADFMTATE